MYKDEHGVKQSKQRGRVWELEQVQTFRKL